MHMKGPQIFQNPGSHLKILNTICVLWSKFHTEDPQILGTTVQNLVARATRRRSPETCAPLMFMSLRIFTVKHVTCIQLALLHCIELYIINQSVTAQLRLWFRADPYGICGGQSSSAVGSSPNTSVFPCHYHSTNAPYSLIRLSSPLWLQSTAARDSPLSL